MATSQREAERRGLLRKIARHLLDLPPSRTTLAEEVFSLIRNHLDADLMLSHRLGDDGLFHVESAVGCRRV